jgi:YfiH family protein
MKWQHFEIFRGHPVRAALSLRGKNALKECQLMAAELGFRSIAQLRQVHGNRIIRVEGETPPPHQEADALTTDVKELLLMVSVADCAPVFLFDSKSAAIALVHAGWRGIVSGIVSSAISIMQEEYGSAPEDLIAAVGPSLGPCCASFSDPTHELPHRLHAFIGEGNRVDLWAIIDDQLKNSGVREENTEFMKRCTVCYPDEFYSHRRGESERMGAFLGFT